MMIYFEDFMNMCFAFLFVNMLKAECPKHLYL
jgi:hypothetical protein